MALEKPSVLIIGAGIAGLAAGCYAQMNGCQAQIFELHDCPRGMVAARNRNGYRVNVLRFLFGIKAMPIQPASEKPVMVREAR